MAWTAPRTWVTGEIVTAAIMNTHVRDDLLETAPAKASAAGDLFIGTGANALKRLAKGTARQVPQMNSGATDIEWAASPQSVLTGEADLLYASAANVLARLAKGTAYQGLVMNAGATAPSWVASLQSLIAAAGDIIYGSGANTPAKLAKGSARQALVMNAGGTLPEWADVFLKLTAGSGSILTDNLYFSPVAGAGRYILLNGAGALTGMLILQAGSGSAAYGGGLILYSHTHATKPGWVVAGISSGSGGKFAVNDSGIGGGTDVFTVDASGVAELNGNAVWHAGIAPTGSGSAALNDAETTVTHNLGRYPLINIASDSVDYWGYVRSEGLNSFVIRNSYAVEITVSYKYW